jgi:hypothetical protein
VILPDVLGKPNTGAIGQYDITEHEIEITCIVATEVTRLSVDSSAVVVNLLRLSLSSTSRI